MVNIRIEAEKMALAGYTIENSGASSGGKVVNSGSGVGTATTFFQGTAGTYDLIVAAHDENDGESPISVTVDGQLVATWALNAATDSAIASTANLRKRVISRVKLNANSRIEIKGAKNDNEYARLDYLDIISSGGAPTSTSTSNNPSSTNPSANTGISTVGVGRLEAEKMTLSGYTVEKSGSSSGGNVINAAATGTAKTRFTGVAGRYDIKVAYHDENDGRSPVIVKVDSKVVGRWRMDESTDSTVASVGNLRSQVLKGISLNTNSVIEIIGAKEGNEYARLDYIEIGTEGSQSAETPVGSATTIQAEDALLSGAFVASLNGGAQGGKYADFKNASGDFIEWTVNASKAGNYGLSWRYANGAANRPLSFLVNGKTIDSSLDFNSTGSWKSWRSVNQNVALKAGNNKIRLRANGSSGANFDSLTVTPGDALPSPGDGQSKKLRILPLGDSNTKGEGTPGGYRIKFWERAVKDGVAIDFLGTRNNGPSRLGDGDHQGQGGWSIPQMTSWVKRGNLAAQNPDIILFMMGTNDANTNGALSGKAIRNRLSTLIDAVAKAAPSAHLFVSSIMPLDAPRGTAAEAKAARDFNSLIPALVKQKAAKGKLVSFVNAGGSLNVGDVNGDNSQTADQNDGLHATASGYNKLGNAWYNAVSKSKVWKDAVARQPRALRSNNLRSNDQIGADRATDTLIGNSADNFLEGGAGFDELTGGGGSDTFVYKKPSDGLDRITDFSRNDFLRISASGFGGDLVAGRALNGSDYILGSSPNARDRGATFLYDTGNQTLSFDADGTGNGSAVGIATFSNGFSPQASQIQIFA